MRAVHKSTIPLRQCMYYLYHFRQRTVFVFFQNFNPTPKMDNLHQSQKTILLYNGTIITTQVYISYSQILLDSKKSGHAIRCVKEAEDGIAIFSKLIRQFESISCSHNKEKIPKEFGNGLIKLVNNFKDKSHTANSMM